MKTSEILINARQLLIDKGWCQGNFRKGHRFCAIGSIRHVSGPDRFDENYTNAKEHLARILEVDSTVYEIACWNDLRTRTKAQVLQKFDEAISLALSEEALNE